MVYITNQKKRRQEVKKNCSETNLFSFEHFDIIAVVYKSCGEKKKRLLR